MNEYFTLTNLVSFAGALFFSLLVPNVLLSLVGEPFRPFARATALVIALFLTLLGAFLTEGDYTRYVVAVFNGVIVYAAAYGINTQVVERNAPPKATMRSFSLVTQKPGFFQKWR